MNTWWNLNVFLVLLSGTKDQPRRGNRNHPDDGGSFHQSQRGNLHGPDPRRQGQNPELPGPGGRWWGFLHPHITVVRWCSCWLIILNKYNVIYQIHVMYRTVYSGMQKFFKITSNSIKHFICTVLPWNEMFGT